MAFLAPVADAISEDPIHISHETEFATVYYYQEVVSANFTDVVQNVDSLVYKVKQILGIYPPDLRFHINVYSTYSELTKAFRGMGLTGDVPVAFYSHKYRTISLSVERLNDTILAHEIAHAVINSYFIPSPSPQVQEILAHYVEKNLKIPLTNYQSP